MRGSVSRNLVRAIATGAESGVARFTRYRSSEVVESLTTITAERPDGVRRTPVTRAEVGKGTRCSGTLPSTGAHHASDRAHAASDVRPQYRTYAIVFPSADHSGDV